ncbi:MAG: type II secretion system F family protein [Xanthomonadales bacterium]|nr:type II secretion system F family protein [Xanthomonadales bacterium]
MALYEYKAVSPTGETVQGTMEAVSVDTVIARLQEGGNIPLQAREAGGGGLLRLDLLRARRRGMNTREIGQFTQQLATLLGAGLPLDRSLQVLLELAENDRVTRTITDIRDRVREGGSLSDALEAQHGTFGRLYINMVTAGELGGSLDQTLERLSDYLERSKELRENVISAMTYPVLLVVLMIITLFVLLFFVIPQFAPIFEDLGGELPLITQVVMFFAAVLQKFWWGLLLLAIGLAIWLRNTFADRDRRRAWDKRILGLPGAGNLVARLETARLSRTVGTLLQNGVPLLSALSIARNVVTNTVLRDDLEQASREVKTGGGLARNLAAGGNYPRLALQMISVGEETGQLDDMLLKVAKTYDRETRNAIDRLLSLLTPALTVLMAILVGIILLSVLLPILGINQLVG